MNITIIHAKKDVSRESGILGWIDTELHGVTYSFEFNVTVTERKVSINNGKFTRINAENINDIPITVLEEVARCGLKLKWLKDI